MVLYRKKSYLTKKYSLRKVSKRQQLSFALPTRLQVSQSVNNNQRDDIKGRKEPFKITRTEVGNPTLLLR